MRWRKILLAAGFLAISLILPAQAAELGPHMGLKAGKLLTGRFVHEHPVPGFDKPIRSEGSFSVAPGDKIIWSIEKPMATTTTLTKDGLVQAVGSYPLLRLSPQQMPFLAEVESKLLLALNGNWTELGKDYHVKREGNPDSWVITLLPRAGVKGSAKPFQKIVARGAHSIDSADIFLRNAVDHLVFYDVSVR